MEFAERKKWHESLEFLFSSYSIDNPNFVMSRFFSIEIKWKIQFGSSLMVLPFARKVALGRKKKVLIVNVQHALQTNLAFKSSMVGFILN